MTIEAWVRPAAGRRLPHASSSRSDRAKHRLRPLREHRPQRAGSAQVTAASTQSLDGPSAIPAGTWTHLAGTYDGATHRLYVNGIQVAQLALTGAIATSTGPLKIGGNAIWSEWFNGQIDEVRLYSRALSAVEIQADMNLSISSPDGTAPTAPATLTATGTLTSAQLSWGAATDNVGVARYNVHRSTTAGFTPSAANRIGQPGGTSYTDTVAAGTYYYKVTAEDSAGNVGPASNEATRGRRRHGRAVGARDAERDGRDRRGRRSRGAPPRTTSPSLATTSTASTTAGFLPGPTNRVAQPTGTAYIDNTPPGVYFYKVTAEDAAGNNGPATNEATAAVTTDTTAPSTPTGLTGPVSGGAVSLSWSASTDNVAVTRYNVHRSTTSGFVPTAANRIAQPTGIELHRCGPRNRHVLLRRHGRRRREQRQLADRRAHRDDRRRRPPDGTRTAGGLGGRKQRVARLDRGDRQPRRRPVQRPPRDDDRVHSLRRQPDRAADRAVATQTTGSQRAPTSTR